MITINVTPKTNENLAYFTNEIPFSGDITKSYSCSVIYSNSPAPKLIKFITKLVEDIPQNFAVLEFEGKCSKVAMTLVFKSEVEMVEDNKVAFVTWLMGYFTWLNFIFRIFSLKTLKRLTITIASLVMIPIIGGLIYASMDWSYEVITGDDFDDSAVVEWVDSFRFRTIGNWFREDALDDASDFGDFLKDKKEDIVDSAKDKASDLKENIEDVIEDIGD